MNTHILNIDENSLKICKKIISEGGAVAFPTETVYGLGANAFDDTAVNNIFKIKGRPNDNPLIVHVHQDYDISNLVCNIPDYAVKLAKTYLPGPLTMVYKSKGKVSSAVSCGLDTLAIRVPEHKGAQEFLKYVNLPIAAPSANISKHVSPVTAEHVYSDLNGKIQVILDGGKCSGGIESTVLDCTGDVPTILRSGLITQEMISAVAGDCLVYIPKDGEKVKSPGMKYKHYSPNCDTMLYELSELDKALETYDKFLAEGIKVCFLCDEITSKLIGGRNFLNLGKDGKDIASNLYLKLREGEKNFQMLIAVAPQDKSGVMVGVMNRLTKACKNK
ncbi:MAG: threonylcarbamoyl-AMP synthase [Clostridia bacterium]|nr:threonylcarbamoyl-AMP synthase [Clostridia bacterium]